MSKKITQWPWILSDDLDGIQAESGKLITKLLCPLDRSLSENIANAKMMAAAPEIAHWANEVMQLLEKYGPGIVPHLMDTDDNAGQFLRDALKKGGWNE